ncbi:MAG: hypothetical protein ACE15F_24455 [bacterium]
MRDISQWIIVSQKKPAEKQLKETQKKLVRTAQRALSMRGLLPKAADLSIRGMVVLRCRKGMKEWERVTAIPATGLALIPMKIVEKVMYEYRNSFVWDPRAEIASVGRGQKSGYTTMSFYRDWFLQEVMN